MNVRHGLTSGRFSAFAGMFFFLIGAVLSCLWYFQVIGEPYPDYQPEEYRSLDPSVLRQIWEYRISIFPVIVAIDFFEALGLLALVHVAECLVKIFKDSFLPMFGPTLLMVMRICFLMGALLPCLEFLQALGFFGAADWIASWDQLPDEAYISLEVSYKLSQGRQLWLFSIQFIFLSVALISYGFLAWSRPRVFPKVVCFISWFIALVGFFCFCFEIASFYHPELRGGLGISVLVWGVFFLPLWMVWNGMLLGRYEGPVDDPTQRVPLNTEMARQSSREEFDGDGYGRQVDELEKHGSLNGPPLDDLHHPHHEISLDD